MKITVIICLSIFSLGITALCTEFESSRRVVEAYLKGPKKALGSGGFGQVNEFKYNDQTFAVKEVKLYLREDKKTKLVRENQMSEGAIKEVEWLILNLKNFERADKWSDLYKNPNKNSYFNNLTDNKGIQAYFDKIKKSVFHLKKEMEFNKIISDASTYQTKKMSYRFHFCARVNGFEYLVFQEKYGVSLGDPFFKSKMQRFKLTEKFQVYFRILKAIKFVHDQNIVHCDLKQANILLEKESASRFVVVDYGVSERDKVCRGFTSGFEPPEVDLCIRSAGDPGAPEVDSCSPPAGGFEALSKIDTYSAGVMIASLDGRSVLDDLNLLMISQNPNKALTPSENHDNLITGLKTIVEVMTEIVQNNNVDIPKENISLLYKHFENAITRMVAFKVEHRLTIKQSLGEFWTLFQMAVNLTLSKHDFLQLKSDLHRYLTEVNTDLQLWDDLPLNDSWHAQLMSHTEAGAPSIQAAPLI
jgi:serine/threonine protein kinase